MQIGDIKDFASLLDESLEGLLPLLRLHTIAKRTFKSCAMSRHIDLGNEQHTTLSAVSYKLPRFLLGIVPASHAGHGDLIIELGIEFAL